MPSSAPAISGFLEFRNEVTVADFFEDERFDPQSPQDGIVLLDPGATFVVRAAQSQSHQGYTPFEGVELSGRVKSTFLRGSLIYDNGNVIGSARGEYLQRPRIGAPVHKSS